MSASASSQFPPGDLRVSDADRDRAVSELSEHFQAGRITADEFEQRSGQALQARTARDLAALFADLPRSPACAPQPAVSPGQAPPLRRGRVPARLGVAAAATVAALAVLAAGHPFWIGLAPLLVVALFVRVLLPVVVVVAIAALLARRRLIREQYGHRHYHQEHRDFRGQEPGTRP